MRKYLTVIFFFSIAFIGLLCRGGGVDLIPAVCGYENTLKMDEDLSDVYAQEKNRNSFNGTSSRLIQDSPAFDIMQSFQSVLLNREAFLCTDKMPYQRSEMTHEYNSRLKEMSIDNVPLVITEFAAADLDGDDIPEIVLAIKDYHGFIVLRYKEGQVHGNILGYRTMHSLKKDGSFRSSGGASDYSAGRMYFIGDTVVMDQRLYFFHPSYYKHDLPVSKNTFEKEFHSFDSTPDVEWHPYSDPSVMYWLSEWTLKAPFPVVDTADARKDYLDSLSYLIDLTSDYTEKNRNERNSDAEKYYKMCSKELSTVYKLCRKKLSGSQKKSLKEEQVWLESSFIDNAWLLSRIYWLSESFISLDSKLNSDPPRGTIQANEVMSAMMPVMFSNEPLNFSIFPFQLIKNASILGS